MSAEVFPAEPPHVACSCPMCCPAKHEINAALANAAGYTVALTPAGSTCPGCFKEIAFGTKAVEGPFDTWYHKGCLSEPAPAVAAPAEGKLVNLTAKKFAELEGWKFGKSNQATAFKFAESYADRCLEIVVAASTPPPADPPTSCNHADGMKSEKSMENASRDLEGKLRELAQKSWVNYGALTIEDLLRIVHEAAALGRAEHVEILQLLVDWELDYRTRNHLGTEPPQPFRMAAEAIRALKEKGVTCSG